MSEGVVMGYTKGTAIYSYKVRIDLENSGDEIVSKLPGDTEWEFDGTELVIKGDHECDCTYWHCAATYDSPEENDYELHGSVDEIDIAQVVTDALKSNPDMKIDVDVDDAIEDTTLGY